jgi:hypothetical protein
MPHETAVLAFGSLIWDPGSLFAQLGTPELCLPCRTPFAIEFARRSTSRGGAPTLVKVTGAGDSPAQLFVFQKPESAVRDALGAREGIRVERRRSHIQHCELPQYAGMNVLFAALESNLRPGEELTAENLALWAIDSVMKARGGKDGVSYLAGCRAIGCETRLLNAYSEAVALQLGFTDWARVNEIVSARRYSRGY